MSRRDMFMKILLIFTLVSTLANAQQFSSQVQVQEARTNVSFASEPDRNAHRIEIRVAMPETDWCRLL